MKDFFANLVNSKLPIIISLITVFLSIILKWQISRREDKSKKEITLKLGKGDVDLEIKNINPKKIDVDDLLRQFEEKVKSDYTAKKKNK